MSINLLEPDNLKKLLNEMDVDCAVRSILAALSGKKKFVEQLSIECGVMNQRDKEKEDDEDISFTP